MSSKLPTPRTAQNTENRGEEPASDGVPLVETPDVCDECDGEVVSHGRIQGEWVCADCGLVHQVDALDRTRRDVRDVDGSSTRQYGAPNDGAYAGNGLGSKRPTPGDAEGLNTTPMTYSTDDGDEIRAIRSQRDRAERLEHRAKHIEQQGRHQSLRKGLAEIRDIVAALELPSHVRNGAGNIYRFASRESLLPGHNLDAVAAGAVYIAAYQGGTPRPYDVVATVAFCTAEDVRRGHQHLAGNLPSELIAGFEPAPTDLVRYYAAQLRSETPDGTDLDGSAGLAIVAAHLVRQGTADSQFQNRAARTRASAALYLAGQRLGWNLTQEDVAAVVGVARCSVRDAYQALAALATEPSPYC